MELGSTVESRMTDVSCILLTFFFNSFIMDRGQTAADIEIANLQCVGTVEVGM